MNEIAVEFKGLQKVYGRKTNKFVALKNLNLKIYKGQFYGFLGPNGAGKSTAIKCLSGINFITSGDIEVFGYSVLKHPITTKRIMGIVPQEIYADTFFDLLTTLKIQSLMHGVPYEHDWATYLLHRLRLYDERKKKGRELSGGMKRRMMIARALIHYPKVIVLDEPSADIDVELRIEIWNFIRELHREGITLILTTHNLQEAEELCDHITIIKNGSIITNQSKQNLLSLIDKNSIQIEFAQFSDDEILKNFLNEAKSILSNYTFHQNIESFRHIGSQVCLTGEIKRGDIEAFQKLFEIISSLKEKYHFHINDLSSTSSDLEDIFLNLIQGDQS
jgi:ABC-2 type transport system ATP-binding protein